MKKIGILFTLLCVGAPLLVPACDDAAVTSPRGVEIATVERSYEGDDKVLIARNDGGEEVSRMSLTVTDTEVTVDIELLDDALENAHVTLVLDGEGRARVFGSSSKGDLDWEGPMEDIGSIDSDMGLAAGLAQWQTVVVASPESLRGHLNDRREFRVSCNTACFVSSVIGCHLGTGGWGAFFCHIVSEVVCHTICGQIDS